MPDYSALLDKPLNTIEPPKQLPPGAYVLLVKKYEEGVSSQKKTPRVRYTFGIISAGVDVDQSLLQEVKNWQQKELTDDFYVTDDALIRLKEFIAKTGCAIDGRSLRQALPDTLQKTITALIAVEPSQDGQRMFTRIKDYAPV